MPYAFLTPTGEIRQIVAKLSPFMRVAEGERIVGYNPPSLDASMSAASAVTPVPAEAMEVEFTVQALPDEVVWPTIRARRDTLLGQSDWTQLPDVPLPTKAAWADYRQALRDITQQADPHNIIWPTPPQ